MDALSRGAALVLLLGAPALRAEPLPRVQATVVQGPYESIDGFCADARRLMPELSKVCKEALDELRLKPAPPRAPYRALTVLRVSGSEDLDMGHGDYVPAVQMDEGWYFLDQVWSLSYDNRGRGDPVFVGAEYIQGPAGAPLVRFRVVQPSWYKPTMEERESGRDPEGDVFYHVGMVVLCGRAGRGLACTELIPVAGLDWKRRRPMDRWERWDWRLSVSFPAAGILQLGLAPGSALPRRRLQQYAWWVDELPLRVRNTLGRQRLPF